MKKNTGRGKVRTIITGLMMFCVLFSTTLTMKPRPAHAVGCLIPIADESVAGALITGFGAGTQLYIGVLFYTLKLHIQKQFSFHKIWLAGVFYEDYFKPALISFADQMSVTGMHQMFAIGTFFDAKQQLETQRTIQKLSARAHKDYQPSEDFCWFGTNVRSLAASEAKSKYVTGAFSARALSRHLGNFGTNASFGREQDYAARWDKFTKIYCDPKDNNWSEEASGASGLEGVCADTPLVEESVENRKNRDIDYTRLVDEPRTITHYAEFEDTGGGRPTTSVADGGGRDDVFALANNLYGHKVYNTTNDIGSEQAKRYYLGMRSVAAKRSVAENSFNAIVGLKAAGTSDMLAPNTYPAGTNGAGAYGEEAGVAPFLGAVLKELGYSDTGLEAGDIGKLLGQNPSYYVQLEILAKKIYQNPDFYVNLYDTPANVARKKVALRAIELMLDRAIYESQLRQEMVMSVLLSSKLRGDFRAINAKLQTRAR